MFLSAARLACALRLQQISHVHSPWGDLPAAIAMIAARLIAAGFSVQFRASDLHRRTTACFLDEKIRNASFVVTNSSFNETRLKALVADAERDKIHRIYNGLDLDAFPPRRRRGNRPPAETRILSVGRLIEPKGFRFLLEACDALRATGFRFRCRIVGGPELPTYVADYVHLRILHRNLGLEPSVEFLGPQPFRRVVEQYRWADMFVLPCVMGRDGSNDITPNSLIEAMAMGLPVVSTTITAIPEIVEQGVSGILVRPGDTGELARQIMRLIQDPDLRHRLGENARRRVEERFDASKNAHALLTLLQGP